MKHLRYLLMAALVAMPLTACDEDDDPVVDPTPYGTVTGTVAAEGTGLAGVSVTLVGGSSQSATTGAGGAFTFTNVAGGSYGISIDASTHADVSFSQTSKTTTIATDGETVSVDFSGSYIRTATITGVVTATGAALGGVAVDVTGGPDNITNSSVTNAGGEYFATGLRAGTYTVTITPPAGVTFTTTAASVTVATGEAKTAQFPGEAVELAAISGAVTVDGAPVVGVVVTLSGGADATTETGAQGAYTFVNLVPAEYTVTITAPDETTFDDGVAKTLTVGAGETGVASFSGKGPLEPATISIGSITMGGNPIDLTDVSGQIEVAVNIERNDHTLDYVDILIGTEVVATQQFQIPVGPAESADIETVTLNVPTTQVERSADGTAWIPVVWNGGQEISANLYVVELAGEPIPTNKVPVVMQNDDTPIPGDDFGGNLMFLPDEPTRTAEGRDLTFIPSPPVSTTTWYAGAATFTGPQYLSYSTLTPFSVDFAAACPVSAQTITGEATTGINITNTYNCDDPTIPFGPFEGNVWPDHDAATVVYTAPVVGPDGTAVNWQSTMSTLGAEFMLGDGTIGPRRFVISSPVAGQITAAPSLNMDNLAPTVWVDGDGTDVGTLVAYRDDFDQPWINAAYTFVQFDVDGLLDSAGDVQAFDLGVGLDDAATVALDYDWMGTFADLTDDVCTDVVKTTGDDYAETQASDGTPDAWKICGQAQDLLANTGKSTDSNFFGVDKVPAMMREYRVDTDPLVHDTLQVNDFMPVLSTIDGNVFSSVAPDGSYDVLYRLAFEALDGRAGFDNAYLNTGLPAMQSLMHYPGDGTAALACLQFDNTLTPIAGDQYVRTVITDFTCLADLVEPGYFVYDNMVTDRAGNTTTLGTATYAVDDILGGATTSLAPTFDLLGFASTFYNPGVPADFEIWATDDLEVIEAEIALIQPTQLGAVTVNYGFAPIDGFMRFDGIDPYDNTLFSAAAIGQTHSTPRNVFGRMDFVCTGVGAPLANCLEAEGVTSDSTEYNLVLDDDFSMLPTGASGTVQDVGYNQTALGAPIAFIPAQWETATAAPWSEIAPGTAEVIIRTFNIVENTADVDFDAVMEAPTSIEVPFFDSVELVNITGGVVTFCGAFTYESRTDNGVDRFFNYSGVVAAGSACEGVTTGTYHALGVKGAAGLVSDGV